MMINTVYNEDGEFVREEPFDADVELDKLYPTEQTNEEHLRVCSDKEMADIFMRFMFDADFKTRFVCGNFYNEFVEWLKEVAK